MTGSLTSHPSPRRLPPPFLEPAIAFCNSKHTSPQVAGSIRSLLEGGWPSQASLHEAGLADSPDCLFCPGQRGTLFHRLRECQNTAWLRQLRLSEQAGLAGPVGVREEASEPLLRRGVPYAPPRLSPVPSGEHSVMEEHGPAAGCLPEGEAAVFRGKAYTDGSLRNNRPIRARRAGWSAVQASPQGELVFALYGPCPDRCPTAHRAEVMAILHILRRAEPPIVVATDHESAVKAFKRGKAYCCDRTRFAADLWRQIWDVVERLGGPSQVDLVWVKAHTGGRRRPWAVAAGVATGQRPCRSLRQGRLRLRRRASACSCAGGGVLQGAHVLQVFGVSHRLVACGLLPSPRRAGS